MKSLIRRDIHDLIPKHITKDDIFASINYNMHLEYGIGNDDDIDHLGNRRIRAVGELLQNQYRIGLSRLERVVRERMTTQDHGGNLSPVSDQYQTGDRCGERILRFFPAVPVYGSEQPSGRADSQETSVRPGTGRSCQETVQDSRFVTYTIPIMEECARLRRLKVRTSV